MEMLQCWSNELMDWFSQNVVAIYISKAKLLCFHNPPEVVSLKIHLHTSHCSPCHCTEVPCSDTIKYLGIHFDSELL